MDNIKEPEHFIFVQPDKTIMCDYEPENVDGWKVTGELMEKIKATANFDLVIKDGELVDITPLEPPVIPQQPTEADKLSAKIDYVAMMTEVDISGLV